MSRASGAASQDAEIYTDEPPRYKNAGTLHSSERTGSATSSSRGGPVSSTAGSRQATSPNKASTAPSESNRSAHGQEAQQAHGNQ
ncbi:unnamed protein product, partial [Amoebophrya sp. A25]|eukprot:GSA25T00006225001.1